MRNKEISLINDQASNLEPLNSRWLFELEDVIFLFDLRNIFKSTLITKSLLGHHYQISSLLKSGLRIICPFYSDTQIVSL